MVQLEPLKPVEGLNYEYKAIQPHSLPQDIRRQSKHSRGERSNNTIFLAVKRDSTLRSLSPLNSPYAHYPSQDSVARLIQFSRRQPHTSRYLTSSPHMSSLRCPSPFVSNHSQTPTYTPPHSNLHLQVPNNLPQHQTINPLPFTLCLLFRQTMALKPQSLR
jgi:hypothetical protein